MRYRQMSPAKRVLLAAILCLFAILFIDGPMARLFSESPLFHHHQKYAVGSAWLLIPLIIAAILIAFAARNGRFGAVRRATILTTICAVTAFLTNNLALKPLFGRTSIEEFLFWPSHYGFYFFRGNWHSNFPSGHMALLIAALTVLWPALPRWRGLFAIVTAIAAFLLLFGEWHFVSDLIAGALWGNLVAVTIVALSKSHAAETGRSNEDVE